MIKRKKFRTLLAIGILVVLCLIEGTARIVLGLGTPPLSEADPDIEYLFRPNQDVMRFGNQQYYNAYSMRCENFPEDKPAGEYRILCFGDSVLNGGNLTDQEQLATDLLKHRMVEKWGRHAVVGNISAGSWGPPNMLAYAQKYGLFNADYIVVVLSSHDIYDVPTFEPLNPYTHPTRKPFCATWEGVTRYLPRYIPVLKPLLQYDAPPEKSYSSLDSMEIQSLKEQAQKECLQALSKLYNLTQANGSGFLMVLHGEREEVETGQFQIGLALFEEWAHQHDVAVVDLYADEAESLKKNTDPYRNNDTIHPSAYGQRLLANKLFEYFDLQNE